MGRPTATGACVTLTEKCGGPFGDGIDGCEPTTPTGYFTPPESEFCWEWHTPLRSAEYPPPLPVLLSRCCEGWNKPGSLMDGRSLAGTTVTVEGTVEEITNPERDLGHVPLLLSASYSRLRDLHKASGLGRLKAEEGYSTITSSAPFKGVWVMFDTMAAAGRFESTAPGPCS